MTQHIQTLYANATIITVNSRKEVIINGALLVESNRIIAIDKSDKLLAQLKLTNPNVEIIDCSNRIIIPGLINTHAHLVQSLMRGLAEDLPLYQWLCDSIWLLEAHLDKNDGYVAANLTISEMLKSGTTCFLEAMLTHQANIDNVVKAVGETGIRACLGKLIKSVETNTAIGMTDARDASVSDMSLESAIKAYEAYNSSFNDRLHIWFAAGTPRGAPVSDFTPIGEAAAKMDTGITMHCAEAPADNPLFHKEYNCSPIQFCANAKLTSRKTVLAHVVHLDPEIDFPILARTGTTASHNPSSNCKLGSGIAAVPDMLSSGVNVALGTDGAPCNNTYDMIREMHLAAILHAGARQEADVISAYKALEMATINGARALGLEQDIGSLEVGKKADFVVINPSGLHAAPWDAEQVAEGGIDPVTVVVHSCSGRDVETVVVDGQILVRNGELVNMDELKVLADAKTAVAGIRSRSGVKARNTEKLIYL